MEEQTTRYGFSKNVAYETWLFSSRLITFGVTWWRQMPDWQKDFKQRSEYFIRYYKYMDLTFYFNILKIKVYPIVRSEIWTHAQRTGLRPERSALDHSAILTLLGQNKQLLIQVQVRVYNLIIFWALKVALALKGRTYEIASTCSVVVITAVSHTAGPQFDPGQVQLFVYLVMTL